MPLRKVSTTKRIYQNKKLATLQKAIIYNPLLVAELHHTFTFLPILNITKFGLHIS